MSQIKLNVHKVALNISSYERYQPKVIGTDENKDVKNKQEELIFIN